VQSATVRPIGTRHEKRKNRKRDRAIKQAHFREFVEPRGGIYDELPYAPPPEMPPEPPDEPPDADVREPRGPRPAAPSAAVELDLPDEDK
jgi:hypothetical protein